jgi:diguanylate cyclase (GGDEF)-like protein
MPWHRSNILTKPFVTEELHGLLLSSRHSPEASRERFCHVVSRAQQIARLFTSLTVAWIVVDVFTLNWPLWGALAIERLAAAAGFLMLARHRFAPGTAGPAYRALATLIGIPVGFFLLANLMFWCLQSHDRTIADTTAYFYSPFIIAAGLSIFPLTAIESALFATPVLAAMALSIFAWPEFLGSASPLATLWRLILVAAIGGLAGMSQLRFLISLTEQSMRDALTKLLTRKFGEQLLDLQFAIATRSDTPLAVLFIDLDMFKSVNDRFGHQAGDAILQRAAQWLRETLRHQDIVVRWGGEEFLVILPETDDVRVERTIDRIAGTELGFRPDGVRQTVSIGVAERIRDQARDWPRLVELADQRMYAAKRAGRNRYVGCDGKAAPFFTESACQRTTPVTT